MVDVGFCNELVQERVPLLIANLVLDGDQDVLQVHDGILKLHGALGHISLLPSSLHKFLLPLDLGLGYVLGRGLHVLNDLSLSLL